MSAVNLLGNLVTPSYDSLYIVHNSVLAEAKRDYPDETFVDGAVGELMEDKKDPFAEVWVDDKWHVLQRAMTGMSLDSTASNRSSRISPAAPPTNSATDVTAVSGEPQHLADEQQQVAGPSMAVPSTTNQITTTTAGPQNPNPDSVSPTTADHSTAPAMHGRSVTFGPRPAESSEDNDREKKTPWGSSDARPFSFMAVKDMDTRLDKIHKYPGVAGGEAHCVVFSCPKIQRTDNIPATRILRENRLKRDIAFFHPDNRAETSIPPVTYIIFTAGSLMVGLLSLIPYGTLSHFREPRGSTHAEHVWTMIWLVFGVVIGTFAGFWSAACEYRGPNGEEMKWYKKWPLKLAPLAFAAPGVGGFVVVGKMLREYGNCVSLF
jgi:hypothetical protein